MTQLPSLNALRMFDAVASHGSMTAAAKALHVTHGAISRQITQLEDVLGVALFHRLPRGLALTDEGVLMAGDIRQGFEHFQAAMEKLQNFRPEHVVNVTMLSSFAARWLVSKLHGFGDAHPDIDVRISTGMRVVDFNTEDVDLAIRMGPDVAAGLDHIELFRPFLVPVASPRTLQKFDRPLQPADLLRLPLIHDEGYAQWKAWFRSNGVDNPDLPRGHMFNDLNVTINAAIQSPNIALIPQQFIRMELETGLLVEPFPTRDGYLPAPTWPCRIVYPKRPALSAGARAFRDWLVSEVKADGLTEIR